MKYRILNLDERIKINDEFRFNKNDHWVLVYFSVGHYPFEYPMSTQFRRPYENKINHPNTKLFK